MTSLHARLGGKPLAARKPSAAVSQERSATPVKATKHAKVGAEALSTTEVTDPFRQIWSDPQRFSMLSSGAQSALLGRFGDMRTPVLAPTTPQVKDSSLVAEDASAVAQSTRSAQTSGDAGRSALAQVANVTVNNPADDASSNDTQFNSAIAVVGSRVATAYFDAGGATQSSNFQRTGVSNSVNGGTSFTTPAANSGLVPFSPFTADTGNPSMAANPSLGANGRVYLVTSAIDTLNFIASQIDAFYSDNGGATYTGPINATPGLPIGDFADKPWVTVDNTPGAGQGNVYMAFRNFSLLVGGPEDGIVFYRSVDNGLNWGPNQGFVIDANPLTGGPQVVVDAAHSVFVFYSDYSSGTNGVVKYRRSTDAGVTFEPARVAIDHRINNPANRSVLVLHENVRATNFISVAAHPTKPGRIYIAFAHDAFSDTDVNVRTSGGVGVTDTPAGWQSIASTSGLQTQGFGFSDEWNPSLAMTPDGSRLMVSFNSGWDDDLGNSHSGQYAREGAIVTLNNGAGGDGEPVTVGSFFDISDFTSPKAFAQDPTMAPTAMGDYEQSTADNSFFYATWTDCRVNNGAIHRFQPDIRFAKVPVAGPGGNLKFRNATFVDGGGNGVIDVNECFDLRPNLRNYGSSTVTGITATLTTSTPGVLQSLPGTDTYPNAAAGAIVANSTANAFRFYTLPTFQCGRNIDFTLTVTTATDGTFTLNFSVPTGGAGAPVTFASANAFPIAIPDGRVSTTQGALATSTVVVPAIPNGLFDVQASVQITHPNTPSLQMLLTSPGPNGQTINLASLEPTVGANYGTNCANRTQFSDGGGTFITAGAPPYVGTFRPEIGLRTFRGLTGAALSGTWTLTVKDVDNVVDAGVINCFSLIVTPALCNAPTCPLQVTCTANGSNVDPTTGVAPFTVNFAAQALGGVPPYTYSWNFGDGSPLSNAQSPTHIYTLVGNYNAVVTATDSAFNTVQCTRIINVICPTITFFTVPLTTATGTTGVPYNSGIVLATTNSTNPLNFTVQSGALPPGVTLQPLGPTTFQLAGTPTASGTFNFTIRAADSVNPGCFKDQAYTITINCVTVSIAPAAGALAAATTGTPYAQTFTASNVPASANLPYTFSLQSGTLPTGLSFDFPRTTNTTVTLSGTPTVPGPQTFNFVLRATDTNGCFVDQAYSLTVNCPTITSTPANGSALPNATAGVAYAAQNITFVGETTALSVNGAISGVPPGMTATLNGVFPNQQITVSGTPTLAGAFTITAPLIDVNGCTYSFSFTIQVVCPSPLTLNPTNPTLPGATEGIFYSLPPAGFTVTGSAGPFVFTVSAGTLPPGLLLDANLGTLEGIPTKIGDFSFSITATAFGTCTATRAYTLKVVCPTIVVNPATFPNGTTGVAYNSGTISMTGGASPYTFTATPSLPPGLAFSANPANTTSITGTPTAAGTYTFTVTATDSNGECSGSRSYTVTISCPTMTFTPAATLPAAQAGVAYNATITVGGSNTALTLTTATGLPTGLSASLAGTVITISGTPTVTGTFTPTFRVTDANGCFIQTTFNLVVGCNGIFVINPTSAPAGQTGQSYNLTMTTTGNVGAVTFAVTTGSLPLGLTLSGNVISGIPALVGTVNFTVTATDANGCTATRAYSIVTTCGPMTIFPATLPNAATSGVYTQTLTVTGAVGSVSMAISAGSLPPGLTFNGNTGVITGTPAVVAVATTFNFTVTATTPANGCTGSRAYSITVDPCIIDTIAPVVTAPTPNSATVNQTFCTGAIGGTSINSLNAKGFTAQATALATLIAGGSATDNCTTPTRLATQLGGVDITNATTFPVGTNTIVFRWRDTAGNIGTATGTVIVSKQGDLDLDGDVDIIDNLIMQAYLVGNANPGTPPFSAALTVADTDGNGVINIFDVINHAAFIVGNVPCLTP